MTGKKEQNTKNQEGKNIYCEQPSSKNINDSPAVSKENADNDFDKTVPALMKHRVLNGEYPSDQLESDQPQDDEKQQSSIKRNNSVPQNGLSDSQVSRSQIRTKDKNAFCECDRTVPNSPRTAVQYVRDHEVAVGENNEQHSTRWEIEAQVDNNLTTHEPDNDASDGATHHDSNNTPQVVVAPPISQIGEESVTTLAVDDQQGQTMQSDMSENVCMTPADTQLNSKYEACTDCDGTNDHEEDQLQPLNSEQNSVKFPPLMAVSPQLQLDVDVYSPQHDSGEISVDSQPIFSPPEQQQPVIGDQEEDPLQNLSYLPSDSLQQLSDTSELKDGPRQCHLDENPINHLPHVAISSQQQPDSGDQKEGPPQLHSDDSAAHLSPHVVVPPTQPQPQHLVVNDGKDDPLKQLLSVENFLSDHPSEGGAVQDCSNENTIDKFSPCAETSSQQQSDTGNQREDSSPHLLPDKHSADNPSPALSESSRQHSHSGDLDKDQLVQDQSDKNSIDLSSCSSDSSKQQLDAGNNCPPQLPSERKSQVNFVVSTLPQKQPYPIGQKEGPLQSASDISEHSPPTTVISLWKSDERSDEDLLVCTALSPQPAVNVREKGHRKYKKHHRKKHRRGKARHLKPHKKWLHSSESPHTQPSKSKESGPVNRSNNSCPINRGSKNSEKQGGSGGHKYSQGERGSSCTQQVSSFGGNGDDNDGDKDRDREPYSGRRNFRTEHKDLNWILLLLIVLLILCFCIPQQASHTDTESVCSTGQHQTTSLDLKSSHFPDSSLDECTPALFRGGIFSKQRENGGEESASSSTFPGGHSTDHLVSEEETPRFTGQGQEMAGLKKLHLKRRERERPHTTPSASPGPQLDFNISGEGYPVLTSEPKLFTCPSPDDSSQEVSRDYDASQRECTRTPNSEDKHMIFHSNCVFKSSKLTCGSSPNVRHILTDVNICHHQQSPPLHYVTKFSIADSSDTTLEHEEDEEQGDDDPPSQFRGPGTTYKKSPGRSEGRTLDSGVGTKSASNQVPTTQIPPVAAATIDTSWCTSLKKEEIVYLRPSTDDIYHSSFQTILSVEERTPRLPNCRDELVGVKQFNHNDNSKKESTDALSLQPPEPLFKHREWTSLLLEPSMKLFPYPSPGDESFIPGDGHVFVAGSTLYASRKLSSPVMCSVLTDATIGQSQQYPLRYFTTKY